MVTSYLSGAFDAEPRRLGVESAIVPRSRLQLLLQLDQELPVGAQGDAVCPIGSIMLSPSIRTPRKPGARSGKARRNNLLAPRLG
jgi:hypothetical protein